MFDLEFEGEREKRRERERNGWVREKERRRRSLGQSWLRSFILVFTDRITNRILNINIFNIFFVIPFVKSNWYLGPFTKKITEEKLNINICNIFIGDSVCKVKCKFQFA